MYLPLTFQTTYLALWYVIDHAADSITLIDVCKWFIFRHLPSWSLHEVQFLVGEDRIYSENGLCMWCDIANNEPSMLALIVYLPKHTVIYPITFLLRPRYKVATNSFSNDMSLVCHWLAFEPWLLFLCLLSLIYRKTHTHVRSAFAIMHMV